MALAWAAVAILIGLAVARGLRDSRRLVRVVTLLVVAGHFASLAYDPRPQIPTPEDRRAGDELVELLAEARGPVLVPYHGYLGRLAGKDSNAHQMAGEDIMRAADRELGRSMLDSYETALRRREYALVVVDDPQWFGQVLHRHYRYRGSFRPGEDVFYPVTGEPLRPGFFFVPAE